MVETIPADAALAAIDEVRAQRDQARAEVRLLRSLWQDEHLVSDLFDAHMRGDVRTILRSKLEKKTCGFCKNGPVGNAATWLDGKRRPQPACPRCGKRYDENGNELS